MQNTYFAKINFEFFFLMLMKKLTLILIMLTGIATASAQYNNITYNTQCDVKLVQIDQKDNLTYLFFSYKDKHANSVFVSSEIKIKSPGSYRPYKLKDYKNITTEKDSGSKVDLSKSGHALNFVLIFDKFPLDKEFSICESDENDAEKLNFTNVSVNTSSTVEFMNINDFIAKTPIVANGESKQVDGVVTKCVQDGGLSINATNSFVKEYGRYQRFFLDFKNNTGHDVDLKASDVSVSARYADGDVEQMDIIKLKEVISKINSEEVLSELISIGTLAASAYTIGAVVGGGNITTDTWYNNTSSTMFDVNNAAHMFLRSDPEKYKDVLKKYYLTDTSIKNGAIHGCMFNVKDKKKIEQMIIKLKINGKEHNFDFTLKHQ